MVKRVQVLKVEVGAVGELMGALQARALSTMARFTADQVFFFIILKPGTE